MQLLQQYSIRCFFGLMGIFLALTETRAGNGGGGGGGQVRALSVLDGSKHQIKMDSSITVEDSTFFNPSNAGKLDTPYLVQNQVTLMINEASTLYLRSAFSVTVRLFISSTDDRGHTDTTTRSFTVGYDSLHTYNSRSSFTFTGAHKVTVKVISDSSNVTSWDPSSVLLVENQLTAYPNFFFNCSKTVSNITVSPSTDPTADELPVSWTPVAGADQYDVEWTWLDTSAMDIAQTQRFGNPFNPALVFRNSATRVTTTGTSYNIPLIYDDSGALFIRVRPVQLKAADAVVAATWSSDVSPAVIGRYDYGGHERPFNWQSNISYAEEGKRKVVLQYYDGSLRSRQTVTKDNTTNTTIVGETYYDYQGRPAIQVMPSPTLNTIIKYTAGFNVSFNSPEYSQSNFDTLPLTATFCDIHADSMSNTAGASNYYSPKNPVANIGLNQFIPDAEDYPFTETEYTQDNTGRISRQGGVGRFHQLGSGHETKYYYGTPDQNELDALFGTEVGDKSHYFKNMVRDANGQYSVNYVDMHGRTIATALAGLSPNGMSALPSNSGGAKVTETLADSGSVSFQGQSMVSQKSLLVPMADTFNFHYNLLPDSLHELNCQQQSICYTCRYDLDITITDNCNNQLLGGQPYTISKHNFTLATLASSCYDTLMNFDFSIVLPEGSYVITKRLTVNSDAYSFYRDSIYLPNNTCTTIGGFIQKQKDANAIVNTQCAPSCAACQADIGSPDSFRIKYNRAMGLPDTSTLYQVEVDTAYQKALASCAAICQTTTAANDIQNAMLQDMTPPYGQYADTLRAANSDPYSIFFIKPNDTSGYTPVFKLPSIVYKDDNNRPDSVFDTEFGRMVTPNSLSQSDFVANFRSSWANALLPYHPEYCKLQVMDSDSTSLVYDRKMQSIDTWQEACATGYLNPLGLSLPFPGTNIDPLKTALGSQFQQKLTQYVNLKSQNLILSVWGLAFTMVKCDSADQSCPMQYGTIEAADTLNVCDGDKDLIWKNFRQLYQGVKQDLFFQELLDKPAHCTVLNPAYSKEPAATDLFAKNHQPQFSDAETNQSRMEKDYTNVNSLTAAGVTQAKAQASLDSMYRVNVYAYNTRWLQQLSVCALYDTNDVKANLIPALDSLCVRTCDADHPYGASSLPTGVTISYLGVSCNSFQDIINKYNQTHGYSDALHCSAENITSPLPYYNQPIYSAKPVYSRPSDCECSQISDLYNRFTVANHGDASFAAYLQRTQHINMVEADLDQLLSMCSNTTNSLTCKNLSKPILLPPVMQCNSGGGCSTCQAIDSLYNAYAAAYPSQLPSIASGSDSAQAQKNTLFQNYMNNRLGYNLSAWEYLQFRDTCSVHSADTARTSSCLPTTIAQLFGSNGTDVMSDIRSTSDGGYVLVGTHQPSGASFASAYIMRYNSAGNIQWARTYSSTDKSDFFRVKVTSDNNYIAVGTAYYSSLADTGRLLVVKVSSIGDTIWQRSIGFKGGLGSRGEMGFDIIQTQDGGYAVVGDHNINKGTSGPANILVAKLDTLGNVSWAGGYGSSSGNDGYGIAESGDTLLVVGRQGVDTFGVQGVFLKLNEHNGAILSSLAVRDTAKQFDPIGDQMGLQFGSVSPSSRGYKFYNYISLEGRGQSARVGEMEISFTGSILKYNRFNVPPGNDDNTSVKSLSVVPTVDGGWLCGETGVTTNNIYWIKIDAAGNKSWTRMTRLPNTQMVGMIAQKPDSSFTVLGTDNNTAMLLNLSPLGAAGCYDSLVDVMVTSPPLYVFPQSQSDSLLTISNPGAPLTENKITISSTLITCPGTGNCYLNYNGPLLCGKSDPLLPPTGDSITTCSDSTVFAVSAGMSLYSNYSDSLTGDFEQRYLNKCMQAYKHETFTVTHTENEYHYTLYYYDQADNLLKTIPPAGVHENTDTNWIKQVEAAKVTGTVMVPAHTLITNYRYNTLNQVVSQRTPDAGTSYFWYDRLGRLALSQNARQVPNHQYSYTQYDSIGRIVQVGQLVSVTAITDGVSRIDSTLKGWEANVFPTADQITVTTYDTGAFAIVPYLGQRNMRNRVSWTALFNKAADFDNGSPNAAAASYYTYDVLGNVDTLLQDYGGGVSNPDVANSMNLNNNRFKKIVYDFDLVSGKMNKVSYQHGDADAFYHTYLYDAENRITNVQSSTDSVNWDNDAFYSYYAHGPLARTVLGQQQVQSINYAYTLQGWLKSINPAPYTGGTYTLRPDSAGNIVAGSAYNVLLNYHDSDYVPISHQLAPDSAVGLALGANYRPLYNGNISSMGVNVRTLNGPMLYNYQYDQLNRLIHMGSWKRTSTAWSALTPTKSFQENIAYDPNGNILKYKRNGDTLIQLDMDSLNYAYTPGTNKLDHITDSVLPNGKYNNDLTSQDTLNYKYDSIGELVADNASHITKITWTVYGKIDSITKAGDTVIHFTYDAGGNRVSKSLTHAGETTTTWYVHDAQGNVLSVYTYGDPAVNGKDLTQTELHLYGSSRLGIWNRNVNVAMLAPGSSDSLTFARGTKFFELTNHLGNVLATISDKRYGVSTNDSTSNYFIPEVVSANDYYPFGSLQPGSGRSSKEGGINPYRYGFNGKEQDPEVEGVGNIYDYGFRIYDPRIGRFLSVDPLFKGFPYYTPYQFAGNMPIWAIDLDGLEEMKVNSVAHVIKDINGNIITKPTVVNDPASSADAIPGVRRLNTGQVEVTPGLIGQKDPYFNTFTWQQVNGKDFIIKQSNTPIGQDAGGTVPPKTNLEQNNDDVPPPAGRTPVITPINHVDVQNQTLTRNINFVPGYPEFAADADRDAVNQVAGSAPNSTVHGKPVTTTNGNTTSTTQTTRQVRSIVTVDLKTDKHDPNLQTNRYNLIRQQLINSGVPAKNIRRGTTQYDQTDDSMGGRTNQTIFRVRTTRSASTTGTSTTTQ